MACCPFHKDRHPSMKADKIYHCFACGVAVMR
ncbi:MAG: CHC2 zinc finger domain-containing protein [Blautia obeum]